MKKILMMAAAAVCVAAPALATEHADGAADIAKSADYCISKADTNADGMVAKDEMAAYTEKMFMSADANSDGMVSRDEMIAEKTKMHEEMMGAGAAPAEGAAPAADAHADEAEGH